MDPELPAPTKDYTSQLPLWLLKCNKCIMLVQDVESGGGCERVGAGGTWRLYLLLNSLVALKT